MESVLTLRLRLLQGVPNKEIKEIVTIKEIRIKMEMEEQTTLNPPTTSRIVPSVFVLPLAFLELTVANILQVILLLLSLVFLVVLSLELSSVLSQPLLVVVVVVPSHMHNWLMMGLT